MNLNVHFMALLIAYYLIIQLFQMERICVCVCVCLKCYIECDALTYVEYIFFNHQLIWKHFCLNIHFIYNYCLFKILDYIYKNKIWVLAWMK
jgi:hypothetical protein